MNDRCNDACSFLQQVKRIGHSILSISDAGPRSRSGSPHIEIPHEVSHRTGPVGYDIQQYQIHQRFRQEPLEKAVALLRIKHQHRNAVYQIYGDEDEEQIYHDILELI